MLPGPDRIGISQYHGFVRRKRPDAVGNEPIGRPVAPTDDIAGAHRCNRRCFGKKAAAETGRQELRTGLAVAVRIMPPKAIILGEGSALVVVFVDLVAGYDEHPLKMFEGAAGLQQDGGSHY